MFEIFNETNKEIKEDKSNEETKEVDYDSLDTLGKLEYLSTKDKRINKIIDNYDKYPCLFYGHFVLLPQD